MKELVSRLESFFRHFEPQVVDSFQTKLELGGIEDDATPAAFVEEGAGGHEVALDVIGVQQAVIHTFNMSLEIPNDLICSLRVCITSTQETLGSCPVPVPAVLADECCHMPVSRVEGHAVVTMPCVKHRLDRVGGHGSCNLPG